MNENSFHSFMVADQVFLQHLPVVHDVNGSYQSWLGRWGPFDDGPDPR